MKKAIFYITILALATGCKEGWTNEHKEAYMQACADSPNASGLTEAQRKAYCNCSMEEVMKHYATIEEVIINKDSAAMSATMLQCRTKAMQ